MQGKFLSTSFLSTYFPLSNTDTNITSGSGSGSGSVGPPSAIFLPDMEIEIGFYSRGTGKRGPGILC